MDDVASHVRLFKKARLMLKTRGQREGSHLEGGKVFTNDLESLFFDAEVAMEGSVVCRDLVSTIHQEEIEYLQVSSSSGSNAKPCMNLMSRVLSFSSDVV